MSVRVIELDKNKIVAMLNPTWINDKLCQIKFENKIWKDICNTPPANSCLSRLQQPKLVGAKTIHTFKCLLFNVAIKIIIRC
jgi:hypothetical protein